VLTELETKILAVFDEYVFGFMRADINAAIDGKANYLAALGLVSYTEVLGGLRTGKLGMKNSSAANFKAFLPYLGPEYEKMEKYGIDIYDTVRCGLVHNYFIKGDSTIWLNASANYGIISSPDGPTDFLVDVYARDFFAGATRFRNEILEGKVSHFAENFEKGMKMIGVWK